MKSTSLSESVIIEARTDGCPLVACLLHRHLRVFSLRFPKSFLVGGLVVLSLGLTMRIAALWHWQKQADAAGDVFRFGDSHSYWVLATRIAKGEKYEYGSEHSRIFRAPLYPLVLAPWTQISDMRIGAIGARLQGVAMGIVCILIAMLAAYRLAGPIASLAAGCFVAMYPGAIGMSVIVLSEAVFCPLMLSSLYCLSCGTERRTGEQIGVRKGGGLGWYWCLAGIFSGLACLARPSWFLFPPFAAAWMWTFSKDRYRTGRGIAFFALGVILSMSPWWIRNYQETGKFVPTTLQVGASLYDGWHEGASGSSDENMNFVDTFAREQQMQDREMLANGSGVELDGTFEYRLDRRIYRSAISWAMANPSDVVRLSLVKLGKTWSPLPTAGQIGNRWVRYGEAIAYLVILALAGFGWWELRREGWRVSIYAIPSFYFAGLHAIFIGSVRYRQPAIVALCILAGCAIAIGLNRRKWRVDRDQLPVTAE